MTSRVGESSCSISRGITESVLSSIMTNSHVCALHQFAAVIVLDRCAGIVHQWWCSHCEHVWLDITNSVPFEYLWRIAMYVPCINFSNPCAWVIVQAWLVSVYVCSASVFAHKWSHFFFFFGCCCSGRCMSESAQNYFCGLT